MLVKCSFCCLKVVNRFKNKVGLINYNESHGFLANNVKMNMLSKCSAL